MDALDNHRLRIRTKTCKTRCQDAVPGTKYNDVQRSRMKRIQGTARRIPLKGPAVAKMAVLRFPRVRETTW